MLVYVLILFMSCFLTAAFYYRRLFLIYFPDLKNRYERLPAFFSTNSSLNNSSFQADIETGLTSETFDLNQNVVGKDDRPGLENAEEIKEIMKTEGLKFDQARLLMMQRKFKTNDIDPQTGVPKDPKLVTFSSTSE
ncbi:16169_t:CDS:2 [Acaulospora morrowiae]|uniref:16169_t:CDS:1 n=1 Tax=Acaulospora morrowiae TaxID=94023 RepID=A0A9N8ZCL5_9GLOM|nr:16169_t:CDS:2 [Acaulospora morrowiae]